MDFLSRKYFDGCDKSCLLSPRRAGPTRPLICSTPELTSQSATSVSSLRFYPPLPTRHVQASDGGLEPVCRAYYRPEFRDKDGLDGRMLHCRNDAGLISLLEYPQSEQTTKPEMIPLVLRMHDHGEGVHGLSSCLQILSNSNIVQDSGFEMGPAQTYQHIAKNAPRKWLELDVIYARN